MPTPAKEPCQKSRDGARHPRSRRPALIDVLLRLLPPLLAGGPGTASAYPDALMIHGACDDQAALNTGMYYLEGTTASGAPFYHNNGLYLYWDPSCDGTMTTSRWILDDSRPSVTAVKDLDGDGSCLYKARLNEDDPSSVPLSTLTWRMNCDEIWTNRVLAVGEAFKYPVALTFRGACSELSAINTGTWYVQGETASGAPYYTNGEYHLFWDPDCNGGTASGTARWILDATAPSLTAVKDLDGDGDCNYNGRINILDRSAPPTGTRTWTLFCNGWADTELTVAEGLAELEAIDVECSAQAHNFGYQETAEDCAALLSSVPECGWHFMFSQSHKEWGCRCCTKTGFPPGLPHTEWRIYKPKACSTHACPINHVLIGNAADTAGNDDATCCVQADLPLKYQLEGRMNYMDPMTLCTPVNSGCHGNDNRLGRFRPGYSPLDYLSLSLSGTDNFADVVDWNNDGAVDLIVGSSDGSLKYFQRTDGGGFEDKTSNTTPFKDFLANNGTTYTRPQVVDWDGDGDRDLIIGTGEGTILYVEQVDGVFVTRNGSDNPFSNISYPDSTNVEPDYICSDADFDATNSRGDTCAEYTLNPEWCGPFYDDNDFTADEMCCVCGGGDKTQVYPPTGLRAQAVDADGDGDLDLLVSVNEEQCIQYYERIGPNELVRWDLEDSPFKMLATTSSCFATAVDWDKDGDLDMITYPANQANMIFWERISVDAFRQQRTFYEMFEAMSDTRHPMPRRLAVTMADLEDNGNLDIIYGTEGTGLRVLMLVPAETYVPRTGEGSPFSGIVHDGRVLHHAVDWDGDGDLDLLLSRAKSTISDSAIHFLETADSGKLLDRGRVTEAVLPDVASPLGVDWDGDGLVDLVVGKWDLGPDYTLRFFKRQVDGSLVEMLGGDSPFADIVIPGGSGQPEAVDFDLDGDLDVVMSGTCNSTEAISCHEYIEWGTCSCVTDPCNEKESMLQAVKVVIGPSGDANSICVDAPVPVVCASDAGEQGKRLGTDTYGDSFNISVNEQNQVCARRLDAPSSGWGMNLEIECLQVDQNVTNITLDNETCKDWCKQKVAATGNGCCMYSEGANGWRSCDFYPLHESHDTGGSPPDDYDPALDRSTAVSGCTEVKAFIIERVSPEHVRMRLFEDNPFNDMECGNPIGGCGARRCRAEVFDFDKDGYNDIFLFGGGGRSALYSSYSKNLSSLDPLEVKWSVREPGDPVLFEDFLPTVSDGMFQLTDWDRDGDLDVIISRSDGVVKFFVKNFCTMHSACTLHGVCGPVSGKCDCALGYSGEACNSCDKGFLAVPDATQLLEKTSCMPCPGQGGSSGMCSTRGWCDDDIVAQMIATKKNMSTTAIQLSRGNGTCLCRSDFNGSSCQVGKCPPGKFLTGDEEKHEYAGMHLFHCTECTPGFYKNAYGDQRCAECTMGKVTSEWGSTACDECAVGKFIDTAGEKHCVSCFAGSYQDDTSSTACKPCPLGRASSLVESKLCAACLPGKYMDAEGQLVCLPCVTGKYQEFPEKTYCDDCPLGTVAGQPGTSECTICKAGKYSNDLGESCIDCAAGTISESGSTECEPCEAGKVAGQPGSSVCRVCPAGKYSDETRQSCLDCAAGTISGNASTTCEPCEAGAVAGLPGSSACTDCAAGKYSEETGKSCLDCGAGNISVAASTSCFACDGGSVATLPGSSACAFCAAGKYSEPMGKSCLDCAVGTISGNASTTCEPCEAGTVAGLPGSSACTECAAGKYSEEPGKSACVDCLAGTISAAASTACSVCDGGSVATLPGSSACTVCAAGKYSEETGKSCLDCDAGTISESGKTTCSACVAGRVAGMPGSSACAVCAAGKYSDEFGQACIDCPIGKISANESTSCVPCELGDVAGQPGSASCTPCPSGKYSDENGETCINCAVGTVSEPGSTVCVGCQAGKYYNLDTATCVVCSAGEYSDFGSFECMKCTVGFWSETIGADNDDTCVACGTGVSTDTEGSSSAADCVYPYPNQNMTCVAGHSPCVLDGVQGQDLKPGIHRMGIYGEACGAHGVDVVGISQEGMSSMPTEEDQQPESPVRYFWDHFSPTGGQYFLCWCHNMHDSPCRTAAHFPVNVGVLTVIGPIPALDKVTVVRGHTVTSLGPVAGEQLDSSMDQLRVMTYCWLGEFVALSEAEPEGVVTWQQAGEDADPLSYGFGTGPLSLEPLENYDLCWCRPRSPVVPCMVLDFATVAAHIRVEGPRSGQEKQCDVGQHCPSVVGISGVGLVLGDRLAVQIACGDAGIVDGVPGAGIAQTLSDVKDFDFVAIDAVNGSNVSVPGETLLFSGVGIYRLCFCRPSDTLACDKGSDFQANVGLFVAKGPYVGTTLECGVGQAACTLPLLRGVGLSTGDELLLVSASSETEPCRAGTQTVGNLSLPADPVDGSEGGTYFEFGDISDVAVPGRYAMCWRPSGSQADFKAFAGYVQMSCRPGYFQTSDSSGTPKCTLCTKGYYCLGGSSTRDSVKDACPSHASTLAKGATTEDECECVPGYYEDTALGYCVVCAAGKYRPQDQEATACLECPTGNSPAGASNLSQCLCPSGETDMDPRPYAFNCTEISDDMEDFTAAVDSATTVDIPVVTGTLELEIDVTGTGVSDKEALETLKAELIKSLAESLGVDRESIDVIIPGLNETRRLTAGVSLTNPVVWAPSQARPRRLGQQFTYTVRVADEAAASTAQENWNFDEVFTTLQSNLPDDVRSTMVSAREAVQPSMATFQLNCTEASSGFGKAFPFGINPTSTEDCECTAGFQPLMDSDIGECEECPYGFYKSDIADASCKACGPMTCASEGDCPDELPSLSTLEKNSISARACVCPPGFFASSWRSSKNCSVCGLDHFCSGGIEREACRWGSSTGEKNQAVSQLDCACDVQDGSPGRTPGTDCSCGPGYYWLNEDGRQSCQVCPGQSFQCKGGFLQNATWGYEVGHHFPPLSVKGYYMTSFDGAEACSVNIEGTSVCNGGLPFGAPDKQCEDGHTGLLCGACQADYTRDRGGSLPCLHCDRMGQTFLMIFMTNVDLIVKSGWALILGKRALMKSERPALDNVIFRIMMQWMAVNSVLGQFRLNEVTLYGWSQDKLMAQIKANEKSGEDVTPDDEYLLRLFKYPPWFNDIWTTLYAWAGSLPDINMGTNQEVIECLAVRQWGGGNDEAATIIKNLMPVIWWVCYPILVMMWLAALLVLLAKVGYPFIKRAQEKLRQKIKEYLISKGAAEKSVEKSFLGLTPHKLAEASEDFPGNMTNLDDLLELFGSRVCAEILAKIVYDNGGEEHIKTSGHEKEELEDFIQQILDKDDTTPAMKRVQDMGHVELMRKLKLAFTNKDQFAGWILELLDENQADKEEAAKAAAKQAAAVDRACSMGSKASSASASASSHQASEEAGANVEGNPSQVVLDLEEKEVAGPTYPILGLFRSTDYKTVLVDSIPVYLIALYSIWDMITQRFLIAIQSKSFFMTNIETGIPEPRYVWLSDMRLEVFTGNHLLVGIVAGCGLVFWSGGFVVCLFLVLRANRETLMEPVLHRRLGFFFNGLEPDFYYWELLVKRVDVLLVYLVTYTQFVPDIKAKLILYLVIAGTAWALHNGARPFDNRVNGLLDRLESRCLSTRFLTFAMLQLLLIADAPPIVNAIVAILLIVQNFCCLLSLMTSWAMEVFGDSPREVADAANQDSVKGAMSKIKFGSSGGTGPLACFQWILRRVLQGALGKLLLLLPKLIIGPLSRERNILLQQVPLFVWLGPKIGVTVHRHSDPHPPGRVRRMFRSGISVFYKLSDEDQRAFAAQVCGQIFDHLLTNGGFNTLPDMTFDFVFAFPVALRRVEGRLEEWEPVTMAAVVKEAGVMLRELKAHEDERLARMEGDGRMRRKSSCNTMEKHKFESKGDEPFGSTAEQLNEGMMYLHRQPPLALHDLVVKFCEELERAWHELFPHLKLTHTMGSYENEEKVLAQTSESEEIPKSAATSSFDFVTKGGDADRVCI